MRENIRLKVEIQLMRHKEYISSFHLRQLFNDMPKDESAVSEIVYWFLIENDYQAIGKPQGKSPKEWLLSVDWKHSNEHSDKIFNQKPVAVHPHNRHFPVKKEATLIFAIWCLCGLLLILLLYWLWNYSPTL
ncbi:hypothetical protein [Larkinella terrae]|uniref:Uncharacterized protein n=1 Tax=Larkinella terrae TaxID=2025311 RepID=A0A7K0EJ87_9BACT|nr:hypothetical protein [Larkinella terrae]MRS61930.1 hypothetical protein [Larkinella terrae]